MLSSFRATLVNQSSTKAEWRGADLPFTHIYADDFFPQEFRGTCAPVEKMLPGPVFFSIKFTEGNANRVQQAYDKLVFVLRREQFAKAINLPMQNALASCLFHHHEVLPQNIGDLSYVYTSQPAYYAREHHLTTLMEKVLPGITELGKKWGQPAPDQAEARGLASEFVPLEPFPQAAIAPVQPRPQAFRPAEFLVGRAPIQPLPQRAVMMAAPVQPRLYPVLNYAEEAKSAERTCAICAKRIGPSEDVTPLKCPHCVHDCCILKYVFC